MKRLAESWTKSGGITARSGHACLECAGQIDLRLLHSPFSTTVNCRQHSEYFPFTIVRPFFANGITRSLVLAAPH